VGLGSNLGDRLVNLRLAAGRLDRAPGVRVTQRSRIYESEPVGVLDQPAFLNAVVAIATTLEPAELLVELKRIEAELGRRPNRRWGERLIDLDLLLYGGRAVESETLSVPHPRMWERLFVLLPLGELAPNLRAPDGRTIQEVSAELGGLQRAHVMPDLTLAEVSAPLQRSR
jgi:2-amino-4-hydroxy-6-hydroxymethyldihydropteridine diphosphokinase